MKYTKYAIKGKNIKLILEILKKEFKPSFNYTSNTGKTYFFVFEKYSFLQNSDMSGIFLVDIKNETECIVNFVVAGGKTELLRLDIFGREYNLLKNIKKILQKICDDNNWKII
jgi:hypothetical protein